MFRDAGPLRQIADVSLPDVPASTVARWSTTHKWVTRARDWDDHSYRIADAARLDALRDMHRNHQLAGRVALAKAVAALQRIDVADISAAAAVRLLDVGARLERSTLATSLSELHGVEPFEPESDEDPWDVIARELSGSPTEVRHTATS